MMTDFPTTQVFVTWTAQVKVPKPGRGSWITVVNPFEELSSWPREVVTEFGSRNDRHAAI
jgi:hypothetical protein